MAIVEDIDSTSCGIQFVWNHMTFAVDEPSKGLQIQGQSIRKPGLSDDFWSTSTYEMENSGVQSQRSISSISTSTQTLDSHGGTGSTSNPSEFVNHGLFQTDMLLFIS
ncbi:hypothetical protein MA16_Dca021946 [Dendrobium catenatum]|uniref:Uncharacterized protein n=1 Tax=Dendrobium catenatum TaxID=906689 RepID=A0A2I0VG75_9ASPA|nr:hypothetical protein MA16_Dca021946 [Dendrobium catenatum]